MEEEKRVARLPAPAVSIIIIGVLYAGLFARIM